MALAEISNVNITEELLATLHAVLMPSAFKHSASDSSAIPFADIGFASTAYILLCTALVMLMTPGVALLYSGLSRSKNALTIVMICFLSYAIVTIQWILIGYSLSFSETGSTFIGNFDHIALRGISNQGLEKTEVTSIPAIVFALYQMQFAAVAVGIIFGSATERIRLFPSIFFMLLWTTLVYDPVTYWSWAAKGWIKNLGCLGTVEQQPCHMGGLDFAGGGPVHMASGAAALALCIFLGHRKRTPHEEFKPHNVTNVFLGTAFLWFGWFGFNGGSAVSATPRAAMAAMSSTVAAASGGLTWVMVDYIRIGKLSGVGFCSGVLAGFVAVTPASGYINVWAGIIIGILGGFVCCYSIRLKNVLNYDDALDAFGLHGVGGFLGSILTAFFADKELVFSLDGVVIEGGVFADGEWRLLGYNLAGSLAIMTYAFTMTMCILFAINAMPGCKFRQSESDEMLGGDLGEMGEVAYELFQPRLPLSTRSSRKSVGNVLIAEAKEVKEKKEAPEAL